HSLCYAPVEFRRSRNPNVVASGPAELGPMSLLPGGKPKPPPLRFDGQRDSSASHLLLDEKQKELISDFIGGPRLPSGTGLDSQKFEHNILMVTGEPGGGKSVLIQEIHASLCQGVVKGQHSFVPVVLFARDLTLSALDKCSATSDQPMRSLVLSSYEGL